MKKAVVIILMAIIFMSCEKVVEKNVVIPRDSEIQFKDSLSLDGCLIVSGDTTGDGQSDIKIIVSHHALMERICFLRVAYPNKDIIIPAGYVSEKEKEYFFASGSALVN